MDIRCSRAGTKCDGCPIMAECEKVELTDEVDLFKIYNQALEDLLNKVVCLRVYDNDLCLEDLVKAKEELLKR